MIIIIIHYVLVCIFCFGIYFFIFWLLPISSFVLKQGWGTPGLNGQCSAGFRYILDATLLI